MKPILFASAALGGALLAGCAGLVSPDQDDGAGIAVRTDAAEYTVAASGPFLQATIGVTLTNGTDGPAYLPTCRSVHPPVLEKRVGDRWVTAYAGTILLCAGPPEVVEPGETFPYTLRVSAGLPGNNFYPKFQVDEVPGTYRLVWAVYPRWDPESVGPGESGQFPREVRTSNEFTLRE